MLILHYCFKEKKKVSKQLGAHSFFKGIFTLNVLIMLIASRKLLRSYGHGILHTPFYNSLPSALCVFSSIILLNVIL